MKFLPKKPGLFITATDTGIGKTVVTSAIASALRSRGKTVGVMKPYATGCRRDREGLVSEDSEALAHFSDCRLPLAVINPIRFHSPLAPAVAVERETGEGNDEELTLAFQDLDQASDVMLIEGIGGLLTPLSDSRTLLDFIQDMGYPVLVVTRAALGTLNHTAMTCRLIRESGLRLAGLVINRYNVDTHDLAEATNPRQLARQNGTSILATIPDAPGVEPHKGRLPAEMLDAVNVLDWMTVLKTAAKPRF